MEVERNNVSVPRPVLVEYPTCVELLSHNAPFNFWCTLRNRGKTTGVKKRAVRRFKRRREGTIWVRRTEGNTKKTKETFFNKKSLKICGLKKGDVKIEGNFAYMDMRPKNSKKPKWERFIEFCTLSQNTDERSADDSLYTLMVLDEGFVKPETRRFYPGDEVRDLMDLYISKKRTDKLQLLILANRENVNNPYFNFFGIDPPPLSFNGIKKYRGGSVVFLQDTTEPPITTEFDGLVKTALKGTSYAKILYTSDVANQDDCHIVPKPKNATHYCAIDFGDPITLWAHGARIYVTKGVDKTRTVVTNKQGGYNNVIVYTGRERARFSPLIRIKREGGIYYESASAGEIIHSVLHIMGI